MLRKMSFDFTSKMPPLPHQIEAIKFVKDNNVVALFDEQGLGKTKIVIDALCQNLRDKIIDAVLVVCEKSLLNTWKKEIAKHSYLQSIILTGNKSSRGRNFMYFSHFYLINYDSIIEELDRIKVFLGLKKFAIVLDESQNIKNPDSKTTKSIVLTHNIPYTLC